jgi:phosphoglycerate dehydrogenase-like enzyme
LLFGFSRFVDEGQDLWGDSVGHTQRQHRAVLGRVDAQPATRPIPGPIAILPESREDLAAEIRSVGGTVGPLGGDTRGIVWLSKPRAAELGGILADYPDVGWVQLPSAGVDGYADLFAAQRGALPIWTSAKGAYSQPVAEHALMLSFALLRQLQRNARDTSWSLRSDGRSLFGRRIVIVGAGGIAVELIRQLQPFDVEVTVVRSSEGDVPGARQTVTVDHLRDVLPGADVVVIAAALTDATRRLIGAAELKLIGPEGFLVNVARGGLVDTDALIAVLASGGLGGAALDVTDPEPLPDGHPLWAEPRCIITSHSADNEEMIRPLLAERVRFNAAAFLGHGAFVGIVDPDLGY